MKLITLNIWGAQIREPFIEFIKRNKDIDIFCFQELYDKAKEKIAHIYPDKSYDIFSEIKDLLPEHNAFFRPSVDTHYGIGIFIKKKFNILDEGAMEIHPNRSAEGVLDGHHSRNLQWIKYETGGKISVILNVHGLWNGMGKTDTPDRIDQSNRIREFMNNVDFPKILCGDFNLRPDTESLKIIEEGLNNLVRINKVTSTRTSFYKREEKFADYIFTSPEIIVNKFEVLPDEVSDHSPLLLDFSF